MRLPYELFLGLRYLGSQGKRLNLSLFVWIGVGGVFLGVAALIVVLAVMTGFQDGIRDRIISANPHLLVFQSGAAGMSDAGRVAADVRAVPEARGDAVRPSAGPVHEPGRGCPRRLVRGVDTSDASVAGDLASQVRAGGSRARGGGGDGILLGVELARALGVLPGDPVTVISPKGAVTAVGMVPKMRRFTVAGTIQVGMHEYDSSIAYLPLAAAREFAGLAGVRASRSSWPTRSTPRRWAARSAPSWADLLGARLDGHEPQPVRRAPAREAGAVRDRDIIVLVAAFAIIGHLVLLVAEKRKEIGILKRSAPPAPRSPPSSSPWA